MTIPGHECNVYCSPDSTGEHCELVWSGFDHYDTGQTPAYESVRRHYDDAYRRRYGARVVRTEPAREAPPRETMDPEMITPLVGFPGNGDVYGWLVWFAPAGPVAQAFAAAEEAAFQARLAVARERRRCDVPAHLSCATQPGHAGVR